jgi:hypothetical protein
MGKVAVYLRRRLLADVLSVLGGWPEPRRKTRVPQVEPRVTPPAQIQDGWPRREDDTPPSDRPVDPSRDR